jgi:hypothetical protein
MNFILVLVIAVSAHLFLSSFVFKFQRVTLFLSRQYQSGSVKQYQLFLTPSWMGLLAFVNIGAGLVLAGLGYYFYDFFWALIYLLVSQFGFPVLSTFMPFIPGNKYFLDIIKNHLQNEISISNNPLQILALKEAFDRVKDLNIGKNIV